ncbi:hypothetical protein ACFX2J_033704 [Malus domestica]
MFLSVMKCTTRTLISFANLPFIPPTKGRRNSPSYHQPNSVKQNQFMVPTRTSSMEGNHNSQKLHTLLIKTV